MMIPYQIIYECILPAFFLSLFELAFFLFKIRQDIENGINGLAKDLSNKFIKLYNNNIKSNENKKFVLAASYQSYILLEKYKDEELRKMKDNNNFQVKIAIGISILLLLATLFVGSKLNRSELITKRLVINTILIIIAFGIFQYTFYTQYAKKYVKTNEDELKLHLYKELKFLFDNTHELNCKKQNTLNIDNILSMIKPTSI